MTAYNRERYIAEAIESVLNSTYENFELIVVDDKSTDQTAKIAECYAAQDTRVAVHQNEKNLGDYPNRNRAASLARGKYLKYVDSDDQVYPHGLEVMVRSMEQFSDAALGLSCPSDGTTLFPEALTPEAAYQKYFFEGSFLMVGPLSAIIRREAFEAVGGFSGARYIGDTELWLKLCARFPVVQMVQGLTWWRVHDQQEFSSGSAAYPSLRLQIAIEALESPHCPLVPSDRERAISLVKRFHARKILLSAASGRREVASDLYRTSAPTKGDFLRALLPRPLARRFRFVS